MLVHKWYFWVIGLSSIATLITIPVTVYLLLEGDDGVCFTSDTSSCVEGKGVCTNHGSTWKCICNAGYENPTDNSKACQDINECHYRNTGTCESDKGYCINKESTWMCMCYDGYTNPDGDTKSCVVQDHCSTDDTSSCEVGTGSCVNLLDNWICECNEGYNNPELDTKTCEFNPCGNNRDITTDEGELEFPAGDLYYYSFNANCEWTLSTDPAKTFILTFTRFATYYTEGCFTDSLRIEDGLDRTEIFCGDTKPGGNGVYISHHNNIKLILYAISDSAGFAMTWRTVSVDNPCVTENTTSCGEDTGDCVPTESTWTCYCKPRYENPSGDNKTCVELTMTEFLKSQCGSKSNFTTEEGELEFPDHSHTLHYPKNMDCEWFISTTLGQVLLFTFTRFDIQWSTKCVLDYLELQDDFSPGSPSVGRFCSVIPPVDYVSKENYVRLRFHSADIQDWPHQGFKLTWISASSCGSQTESSEEEGTLEFPFGTVDTYSNNIACTWNLTTTPGKVLILTFLRFQIELSDSCTYDYLKLQDGSANGKRFCGDNKPGDNGVYTTTSNSILLVFQSDDSTGDEGFKLTWTSDWKD